MGYGINIFCLRFYYICILFILYPLAITDNRKARFDIGQKIAKKNLVQKLEIV
jgi:hypothetical protein